MARFPSPLIEPDVPISGIRLSDWLHRMSFGSSVHAGVLSGSGSKGSALDLRYSFLSLKDPDLNRCFEAHRQSPDPLRRRKRTRSQGPSLHRSYPASPVLCPCPTPAAAAAHVTASRSLPSLRRVFPVTRITFQTCRAHYPGGPNGCVCRCFPARVAFPVYLAGRRPRFTFEACSGFTHVTARPVAQPREAAFVTRLRHGQLPSHPARQLPDRSAPIRVDSASTGDPRPRGAQAKIQGVSVLATRSPMPFFPKKAPLKTALAARKPVPRCKNLRGESPLRRALAQRRHVCRPTSSAVTSRSLTPPGRLLALPAGLSRGTCWGQPTCLHPIP
jgi:hypothetical protein